MIDLDTHTVFEGIGVVLNLVVIFFTMKTKLAISEVKVWILENFERRKLGASDS
jgi:hypothetical protein